MADFRDRVEFRSISKTYPTEAHVDCNYVLKGSHQPSSYDWIGLFKVGWSTNKDVIFYYWAPYPKNKVDDEEHAGSVLFSCELHSANNQPSVLIFGLPKDFMMTAIDV